MSTFSLLSNYYTYLLVVVKRKRAVLKTSVSVHEMGKNVFDNVISSFLQSSFNKKCFVDFTCVSNQQIFRKLYAYENISFSFGKFAKHKITK